MSDPWINQSKHQTNYTNVKININHEIKTFTQFRAIIIIYLHNHIHNQCKSEECHINPGRRHCNFLSQFQFYRLDQRHNAAIMLWNPQRVPLIIVARWLAREISVNPGQDGSGSCRGLLLYKYQTYDGSVWARVNIWLARCCQLWYIPVVYKVNYLLITTPELQPVQWRLADMPAWGQSHWPNDFSTKETKGLFHKHVHLMVLCHDYMNDSILNTQIISTGSTYM